jgi:hypothetical protein
MIVTRYQLMISWMKKLSLKSVTATFRYRNMELIPLSMNMTDPYPRLLPCSNTRSRRSNCMPLSPAFSLASRLLLNLDQNFIGMLLIKRLITYDPEDAKPVKSFSLSVLPETNPSVSCLDALNFFQTGKSHMLLVSKNP